MVRKKRYTFHVFRYQILPVSRAIQLELGLDEEPPIISLEDLLARKNALFAAAIKKIEKFRFHRAELVHRVEVSEDDFIVLKLGAERGLTITTRDFAEEEIENWPYVLVIINNNPQVQKVAIQLDRRVFYRTTTVANILERNLNEYLRQYQLVVRFNPIFEESYFWDIVARYRGRITQAEFAMIAPNLSNISRALNLDLRELQRTTNTQETRLQLKSDPESSLTFEQGDRFIASLVEYASQGGGNISVKVRGVRRKIQTEKGIIEESIDEAEIEGIDAQGLVQIFRDILT